MTTYIFKASLVGCPVTSQLAIRGDQTLADLHELLLRSLDFDNEDHHLYAFWLGNNKYWDSTVAHYDSPEFEPERPSPQRHVADEHDLDSLRLRRGQVISYIFDFGDEWRLRLKLQKIEPGSLDTPTLIMKRDGTPPPQYL